MKINPGAMRPLSSQFLEHMKEQDAMPKSTAVETWLRKHDSIKNGYIGKLLRGVPMSTEVTTKLVRYLKQLGHRSRDGGAEPESPTYVAFREYVEQKSRSGIDELSEHSISMAILGDEDGLRLSMNDIVLLFKDPLSFVASARMCKKEQVHDAIQWMYVVMGRYFEANATLVRAMEIAEARIGLSFDEFVNRAKTWHSFDSWTTVMAYAYDKPVGMSNILPLSRDAYDDVRDGRRAPFEITRRDLRRPSPYILIQGLSEIPIELGGQGGNVTFAQHKALLRQAAILTYRRGREDSAVPVHALTFAPCELVEGRLVSSGFNRLKAGLRSGGYPIFERVLSTNIHKPINLLYSAILQILGSDGDMALAPPGAESGDFDWDFDTDVEDDDEPQSP